MKIGILSDSHDQVWNLRRALAVLNQEAEVLIHCGDLCSPFIVPLLARHFDGPIHAVFGNNDADRYRLERQAAASDRVSLEGESWFSELGGRCFAVHHFDDVGRRLAETGELDVVCFGHNHRLEVERTGDTWLINPGAILGYDPGAGSDVAPTFVVYDARSDTPTTWQLDGTGARPFSSTASVSVGGVAP